MTTANQPTSTIGSESSNAMTRGGAAAYEGKTKTVVMNGSSVLMRHDGVRWWNINVGQASAGIGSTVRNPKP